MVAVDTETTSLDAMQAGLCGFSLALSPNEACYVPIAHRKDGGGDGLFAPSLAPDQIKEADALAVAQAAARGRRRPQGRAEHEIRLAGVRPARHRDRGLRRHHADLLRARRRQRRARHGRSGQALARSRHHPFPSRRRFRQVAGQLRLRRHRQGDRIRRRGRRRDAAAVERAQSRGLPPSTSPPSTRRWSAPCRRCWRAWSGAAFPSTARCCRGCPANSRRSRARSKKRSRRSPASRSIPARPSSSATSCSAR